ncbi:MAG: DUF502 domain-containing protein [Sphaerochaeta sp.]
MNKNKKKVPSFITSTFISGLLIILPIGITVWIIQKIVIFGDSFLGDYIREISGLKIPGIGFIGAILFIFLVGLIIHGILGKKVKSLVDLLFRKVPIVKSIYTPIKEIIDNFVTPNNDNFKKVVLVNYPNEHTKSIGFVTKSNISDDEDEMTAVFIPTTPNPTNGFLVYFKARDITEIDMPVDRALKVVISLGSGSPDSFKKMTDIE